MVTWFPSGSVRIKTGPAVAGCWVVMAQTNRAEPISEVVQGRLVDGHGRPTGTCRIEPDLHAEGVA